MFGGLGTRPADLGRRVVLRGFRHLHLPVYVGSDKLRRNREPIEIAVFCL